MRYIPEQKYHFIRIKFNPKSPRFGMLYYPWEDELIGVEIAEFTCKEHHRVPGQWDDKIEHDGFIFHDKDGVVWTNQYPRASYGQLDSDNDNRIWPTVGEGEERWSHMTDVTVQMCALLRGVRDIKARLEKPDPGSTVEWINKATDSLRQFYVDIDTQLRKEFRLKAVNVGYTARFTNGKPDEHMPHIPDVKLVPVDQQTEHITY